MSAPRPNPQPANPLHGSIRLIEDNCTSCMICARECPVWCIEIESHTEPIPGQAGRERTRNVLDSFTLDWSLCLYCGICIEECPFEALEWAGPHVRPEANIADLIHGRAELA